ncbi:MAG: CHAT domain-containing protein [Mariniblastus sp.]|nr:CHAT domain-containing protein [Mariniblastus sp.]
MKFKTGLILVCLTAFSFFGFQHVATQPVIAQRSGQLPKVQYYNDFVFDQYYQADYDKAGKSFERGFNSAYRTGTRRHLDSICFLTMMGECNYHMGRYAQAIQLYEDALRLYLTYQAENWQQRVQVPPQVTGNMAAYKNAQISWGSGGRRASTAGIPTTFAMLFGRLDAARAFQEGGAYDQAEVFKVNVPEIMRCTALCLHRRRSIRGATCKFDPFSKDLVAGLSVNGAGNGSVMGAYNGVLLGIAQASVGDYGRAATTLKNSLQMNRMDHSSTPVALVELALINAAAKQYAVAGQFALEASYAAAVYQQYDLVEEALGIGTTLHLMSARTPYPPLENAILWAKKDKARLMQASLIQKLAECLAEGGQSGPSGLVLRQTRSVITTRNDLANCVVSARIKYISALNQFLNGNFAAGRVELNNALTHFNTGSLWLFRLGATQVMVSNGAVTEREADQLYSVLLRDPGELDWKTDPMESIAFLASPHVGAMETWFNIVINRKDNRRALEIADLVRRHRFFASLPMGGRLMALRWVMHAPEESLTPEAIAQKQSFLARNPAYQQLITQTKQIETALKLLPLKPVPKSNEDREQLKLMKELAAISETQEAILASFSLRREPMEMAFPPQRPIADFQKSIAQNQVALVTMATATGYHLFLVKSNAVQYLAPVNGRVMLRAVGGLLKKMGLADAALDVKTLQDSEWRESAEELKQGLFGTIPDVDWKKFDELVIIPDGVLWYVPFEALPVTDGQEEAYLSDWINIRYSPSLFLGFGTQRPQQELKQLAVVTARMHSRGEGELSKIEFTDLVNENPDAVQYERPVQIPTNYLVSIFDQLLIWSEIKSNKSGPLAVNPMQIDLKKAGSTLDTWMSLPWAGAKSVVIPGLHSDGGSGMRGKLYGQDLFLTSMAMMASGTRTSLLSRWATGGKSAIDLTKQYVTEMPKSGAAKAILDSRQALRKTKLDYENEPRIRSKSTDPVLNAEHPFFWAAHMLFDIPDGRPVTAIENPVDPDAVADPANPDADKPAENELNQPGEDGKADAGGELLPGEKKKAEKP